MAQVPKGVVFRSLVTALVIGMFLLVFTISWLVCKNNLNLGSDAIEDLKELVNDYMENRKHEAAVSVLEEIHKAQVKALGSEDAETVKTLELWAGENFKLNNLDQSLALYWRVYKIREKTLGPTHSDTLHALLSLGQVYQNKQKYEKALGFFKVVYRSRKILLGPEHAETMEALFLLGNSLWLMDGNPETKEKVIKYHKKVYKVYTRTFGENDEMSLTVLSVLGRNLVLLQQYKEAIPLLWKTMEATEHNPQSELYEEAEQLLGLALTQLGHIQEARQVHKTARWIKTQRGKGIPEYDSKILPDGKFTPEVEDQINAVLNLARVAMAEENFEKALVKLEEVHSIIENDDPRTEQILYSLTLTHGALGNFQQAFDKSIQFFNGLRKQFNVERSDYYQNQKFVFAYETVYDFYLKLLNEHPSKKVDVLRLLTFKETSRVFANTLEHRKNDEGNPGMLKALALAACVFRQPQIAVPAASKLIPILERQRDEEPEPNEEKMEKINADIKVFKEMLSNKQFCFRNHFEIQNHLHQDKL